MTLEPTRQWRGYTGSMSCLMTEPSSFRRLRSEQGGSLSPTEILDWESPTVRALSREAAAEAESDRDLLKRAHRTILRRVQAVYALDDLQSASKTLRRGLGSCSQRMAVLEAVARSSGIVTRSQGLLIGGSFWNARFPLLQPFLPASILLAWPEFLIRDESGEHWLDLAELFADEAPSESQPFLNDDAETLFEAVGRGAADWRRDSPACSCSGGGLAQHVVAELGTFESRDELFALHGQNVAAPLRWIITPVLNRVRAA